MSKAFSRIPKYKNQLSVAGFISTYVKKYFPAFLGGIAAIAPALIRHHINY